MPISTKHLKDLLKKKKLTKTTLLAKWPDNQLYYIVEAHKYNPKEDKCLVEYEDKTEAWTTRSDLHLQFCSSKSPYKSDDDIVCCICNHGTSEKPNEIVLCDVCQQGYHQDCCTPRIEVCVERWSCETCQYILGPANLSKSLIISSTPRKQALEDQGENDEQDESSEESHSTVEQLENGATVEKMQPSIIKVAKALVEKEANICTNEFVGAMAPIEKNAKADHLIIEAQQAQPKRNAALRQPPVLKEPSALKEPGATKEPPAPKEAPAPKEPAAQKDSSPILQEPPGQKESHTVKSKKARVPQAPKATKVPRKAPTPRAA